MTDDIFEKAKERKRRLYEKLNQRPATEVVGVIGPRGAGAASQMGEEVLWELSFDLSAWRDHGGVLHREPLTICAQLSEPELDEFRTKISAYEIARFLARVVEDEAYETPQALMLDLIEAKASDPELQAMADELRKPVYVATKNFGKLTLDRSLGWYEGAARIGMTKVLVRLEPDSDDTIAAVISLAESLWTTIRDWDKRARERACEELLPVKNGYWLEDAEPELTEAQFSKRMKLESVLVQESGSLEFWYDDGDLFWGHSIEVSGSVSEGFTDAVFQG